jgi:hypothetical protein
MKKGFLFLSMRFKLEHKSLPIILELDISFKQIDLKIIITKTLKTEDDGKNYQTILDKKDQHNYIDYFQNICYEIYSSLLEEQKASIELSPKI